jgi:hypothetical protein
MVNPLNQQVLHDLQHSPAAHTKIAAYMATAVRDKLREVSFWERIMPPEEVQASECQVSSNHDGLIKMVSVLPNSRAAVMNWSGSPDVTYLRGPRVEASFFTIMSDMFQKDENEFLAYDYNLAQVVQDNSVRDMAAAYDREGLTYCESAVQAMQAEANGGTVVSLNASGIQGGLVEEYSIVKGEIARTSLTDDGIVHSWQKPDIARLMKVLDGRELETKRVLVGKTDMISMLTWTVEDNGDKVQSETVVNGYKYNVVMGLEIVQTIKTDVLRPGNIYAFTTPDFLGRAFILNRPKFWIDKVIRTLKFVAWKDVGCVIANISSISKLELYSGDATSLNIDGIRADVSPKS